MMVSVAENVTVCPSATIWSTLIKLVEQLSGVVVADVDQSLDGLDLSVAVLDCCAWWRVAVVVHGGHSIYCALRHGRHLGSGVDNGINVALLPYSRLHCVSFLADASGKGGCPLCAQFRLQYWCLVAVHGRQYSCLVSGAACKER